MLGSCARKGIIHRDRKPANVDFGKLPAITLDSQSIAFFPGGHLKKMAIAGGPTLTLCPVEGTGFYKDAVHPSRIVLPIVPN
jgi:hypothetical protein